MDPIRLDLFADLVCPWCYIGKKRAELALAGAPDLKAQVFLRAFELQSTLPVEGVPAAEFFARKFGGPERQKAVFDRVTEVARADGIKLDFSRMKMAPNTFLAHRVVKIAGEDQTDTNAQSRAADVIFAAHFEHGVDIGDRAALLAHLGEHGFDPAHLGKRLDEGAASDEVRAEEAIAQQAGINGVPFFIANGKLALSGAQPPEVLREFLREAARESTAGMMQA